MFQKYDLSTLSYVNDASFRRIFDEFENALMQAVGGKERFEGMLSEEDMLHVDAGLTLATCLHIAQGYTGGWQESGLSQLMHELLGYLCAKGNIKRYAAVAKAINKS